MIEIKQILIDSTEEFEKATNNKREVLVSRALVLEVMKQTGANLEDTFKDTLDYLDKLLIHYNRLH